MKYTCIVCEVLVEARDLQEIMDNKKLCPKHLHEHNMRLLRKSPLVKPKRISTGVLWVCSCGCSHNTKSMPKSCSDCGGRSFKSRAVKC